MSMIKKTIAAIVAILFLCPLVSGQNAEKHTALLADNDLVPTFHKFDIPQKHTPQEM